MSETSPQDEMLNKAIDLTDGRISYVTNLRFHLSVNEIIIDLYQAGPDPKNPQMAQAYRIQRIALPINVAHNLAGLLTNAMEKWQNLLGVNLPISPEDMNEENQDGAEENE